MFLNPVRTGFALGSVLGLYHLCWSALVALGWAQPVLDFILWLHFLKVPIDIQAFDAARAAGLVAVTFAIGWVIGALFAAIWNRLHGAPATARGAAGG